MQLMTNEIKATIPALCAQDGMGGEAVAYVKYFHAASPWTWYVTGFDGKDTFFGLVQGFEEEMGYFTLSELQSLTGIERDIHFKPTKIGELRSR